MKKRCLPLLLTLSLLTGCAASAVTPLPAPTGSLEPVEPLVNGSFDCAETAYSAFAVELLRQNHSEGENALLSPLSAILALGMTANGTEEETLAQFEALFGMGRDTLNSLCAQFLTDYSDLGGSTEATLLNSLWADPDLTLKDSFVLRCQDTYEAELFKADLQSPATVRALNDWVSDATRGLIPSVVDEFSDDAVLALVNAIYLKNRFETVFPTPTFDWRIDFTNADGTTSKPQGMGDTRTMAYLSHEGGQGVVLPYDDGRLGLVLMLPEEGVTLTDYLAGWDGSTLRTLLEEQTEQEITLTVPKFKAEWNGSLNSALANMGLTDAFDVGKANFTAMGDGPLYIGDVIHKTSFEVNEKGTEAAAVTAVVVECGAAPMEKEPLVLRFDRPFVYGIMDLTLGVPLFLGTMELME